MSDQEHRLTKKQKKVQVKQEKLNQELRQNKKRKVVIIVSALVVLIITGFFIWWFYGHSAVNKEISKTDPSIGPVDAPVLVRAYEDFTCAACASISLIMKDLLEEYGDQVRYEFNDFPLPTHPWATTAAVGAECAYQQGKFFEYHDLIYTNQDEWVEAEQSEIYDLLIGYAIDADLQIATFEKCVSSTEAANQVNKDIDEAALLEVNSTPTIFINDQRITTTPFSVNVRQAIEQELAKNSQ